MKNIERFLTFEAKKKITPEEHFIGSIEDVFQDAMDNGFRCIVNNKLNSTYSITITYFGETRQIKNIFGEIEYKTEDKFKFKDIKDSLSHLVNYLQDVYPKMRFTLFSTSFILGRRSALTHNQGRESQLSSSNLQTFLTKVDDNTILSSIYIECVFRSRGSKI